MGGVFLIGGLLKAGGEATGSCARFGTKQGCLKRNAKEKEARRCVFEGRVVMSGGQQVNGAEDEKRRGVQSRVRTVVGNTKVDGRKTLLKMEAIVASCLCFPESNVVV